MELSEVLENSSRDARVSDTERSASRNRISNPSIARCSNTLVALRHADEVLNRHRRGALTRWTSNQESGDAMVAQRSS